jgi:uncharacterized protein YjdB
VKSGKKVFVSVFLVVVLLWGLCPWYSFYANAEALQLLAQTETEGGALAEEASAQEAEGAQSVQLLLQNDDPGDLANEDFENYPIGQKPGGSWGIVTPPADVSATVQPLPDGEPGKGFKLTQLRELEGAYAPRLDLGISVERAVLSYRVYAEQTSGFLFLPRFFNESRAELIKLGMNDSGGFVVRDAIGNKWQKIRDYEANRWYDIRIILDTLTDKYDVYIDGELVVIQHEADLANGKIGNISVGLYRQSTGSFYVDDLRVSTFQPAVSAVLEQTELSVKISESVDLQLTYQPANSSLQSAAWSSSNEEIAAVDAWGRVTGVGPGTAAITAVPYASGLPPVTASVEVYGTEPEGVVLDRASLTMDIGDRRLLTASVLPGDAWNKQVQWLSSNPAVATVSSGGEVRGIAAGTSVIRAVSLVDGNLVDECMVAVTGQTAPPAGELLHEDFEDVPLGSKPQTGWAYGSTPPQDVIIAVTDSGDSNGSRVLRVRQQATLAGSYSLQRSLPISEQAVLSYRVRADQTSSYIYLPRFINASNAELVRITMADNGNFAVWNQDTSSWKSVKPYEAGQWYDLRLVLDTNSWLFDWYIDGELVAAQKPANTASGRIAKVGMGFYRLNTGAFEVDDLNVYTFKSAVSAALEQSEYTIPINREMLLKLSFDPQDASWQSAAWHTDNPQVAAVNEGGRVSGISAGTAVITAYPYASGLAPVSAAVQVVNVPMETIQVSKDQLVLPVDSKEYAAAQIYPAHVSWPEVEWSSSNPVTATVDKGEITALSPGEAVITVRSVHNPEVSASVAVTVVSRTVQQRYYVSPAGDDANPGTEEAPFRTLERAQSAVRAINGQMTGDIVVLLREGTYKLSATWSLTDEDSGTNGYYVHWQAFPGEHPVISGGQDVTGWTLHDEARQIYKASVEPGTKSRQLFIDGVRAVRARSEEGLIAGTKTTWGYTSDDVQLANWARPSDLEFVYMEQWTHPRIGVASVSVANGRAVIAMDEPGWTAATNKGGTSATFPVYYENAYELLDQDGEWYLNEGTNELFYKPRIWENMQEVQAVLPVVEEMVTVKGASLDQQARYIAFTGLTFADTTWLRPSTSLGHSDAQNNHLRYPGTKDVLPPAAVTVERAYSILFERNEFTRLGITGLKLTGGVQSSLIRGNAFYDISGGAINLGDPDIAAANSYPADPRLWMRNNDVLNNYIHDVAVEYMSAAAISAGFPMDMDIQYNEIFRVPYSGMHMGYGWDAIFPSTLQNMKVKHNFIYDIMGNGIYDGGAIYMLGNSGGSADSYNLVAENYIRNQMNDFGPLYPDQGSSFWRFDSNVIDVTETPFWNHGAGRWTHGNSNNNVIFHNNYTTTPNRNSNRPGDNVVFSQTQVYPQADWPQEAMAIIAESGLNDSYADLRNRHPGRIAVSPQLALETGETGQLSVAAQDGKDQAASTDGLKMYYKLDDQQVASVDENGIFTGLSGGQTGVRVYILDGTLLREFDARIFVSDQLTDIALEEAGQLQEFHLLMNQATSLHPLGITELGRSAPLDSVRYYSDAPGLLQVDEQGTATALLPGIYTLTISGTLGEVVREKAFTVRVQEEGQGEPRALRQEIRDPDGWYVDESGMKQAAADGRSITLGSSKAHAVYQGARYLNELFEFDITINATSGWPSVMFRNQSPVKGIEDTTYILTVKPDVIELQRFNNGVRTVLYGNITGYSSLGGNAVPNTMLAFNERHRLQLGAINEAGGVRLIVNVNNQPLINYLDTAEQALRQEGYLGIYARSGSITLGEPEQPDLLAAHPRSVLAGEDLLIRTGLSHVPPSVVDRVYSLEYDVSYNPVLLTYVQAVPMMGTTVTTEVYEYAPGLLHVRMAAAPGTSLSTAGGMLELGFIALEASEAAVISVAGASLEDTAGISYAVLPLRLSLTILETPLPLDKRMLE